MKRRAALLLAGSGAYDGSDPFETVFLLEAMEAQGFQTVVLAPEVPQLHVVDHTLGEEEEGEGRSVFREAGRLCPGRLYPLEELSPKLLSLLVIPGGQGAVKNLLDNFGAPEPPRVRREVAAFVRGVHEAGGAVGASSLGEFVLNALFPPEEGRPGCLDLGPEEVWVDEDLRLALTPGRLFGTDLPALRRAMGRLVERLEALLPEEEP
ncbi:MAG: hypothetical protein ACP5VN_06585 [Acidobacteriota bacterium]